MVLSHWSATSPILLPQRASKDMILPWVSCNGGRKRPRRRRGSRRLLPSSCTASGQCSLNVSALSGVIIPSCTPILSTNQDLSPKGRSSDHACLARPSRHDMPFASRECEAHSLPKTLLIFLPMAQAKSAFKRDGDDVESGRQKSSQRARD